MAKMEGKLTFGWGGDDISPEKMIDAIEQLDDIEKLRHIARTCVAGMEMTRESYDLPGAYVLLDMPPVPKPAAPL